MIQLEVDRFTFEINDALFERNAHLNLNTIGGLKHSTVGLVGVSCECVDF